MIGFVLPTICFALTTKRAISWAVATISTTGISVYCLIMEAWSPLAMMMVAPAAMALLASTTAFSVWIIRMSLMAYFFSCRILWAW